MAPELVVPVARAQVVQAAPVGAALVDRAVLAAMTLAVQVASAARSSADVAVLAASAAPSMAVLVVQQAGADVVAQATPVQAVRVALPRAARAAASAAA